MISLRAVCSDEEVFIGHAYLARLLYTDFVSGGGVYLVVYPLKSGLGRGCRFDDGCGRKFKWKEFVELAEII